MTWPPSSWPATAVLMRSQRISAGTPAEIGERRHMAAQNRLQVLMQDEAGPDQTRVAEHHREQPHDAGRGGLVREDDLELREVDLGLVARRGLEANLEGRRLARAPRAQVVRPRRIAADVAELLDLAPQPRGG